jgi:hypothetical protein
MSTAISGGALILRQISGAIFSTALRMKRFTAAVA